MLRHNFITNGCIHASPRAGLPPLATQRGNVGMHSSFFSFRYCIYLLFFFCPFCLCTLGEVKGKPALKGGKGVGQGRGAAAAGVLRGVPRLQSFSNCSHGFTWLMGRVCGTNCEDETKAFIVRKRLSTFLPAFPLASRQRNACALATNPRTRRPP